MDAFGNEIFPLFILQSTNVSVCQYSLVCLKVSYEIDLSYYFTYKPKKTSKAKGKKIRVSHVEYPDSNYIRMVTSHECRHQVI